MTPDTELTVNQLEQIEAKIQNCVNAGRPIALKWSEAIGLTQHIRYLHSLRNMPPIPLLQRIIEICDEGSAEEFNDASERLRAVRGLIIGEVV